MVSKAVDGIEDNEKDDNDNQFINLYVTYIYQPQLSHTKSIMRSAEILPVIFDDILAKFKVAIGDFPVDITSILSDMAQGESFLSLNL